MASDMFASLFSFRSTFDGKSGVRGRRIGACKQEVEEKLLQPKDMKSKPKKRVRFETKPLVYDDQKAEVCKVKILMTKEEAARLLSKCKDGGRLELKDVARELVHIPLNRVNLVSSRGRCFNITNNFEEDSDQ